MARGTIPINTVTRSGAALAGTAGHSDGHKFQNSGREILRVVNSNASSRTFVVRLTRARDGVAPATTTRSFTQPGSGTVGGVKYWGPFPVADYNQNDGGSDNDYAYLDSASGNESDLTFEVLRV